MSAIQPGDGDPRHGTTNGYGWLWCRCDKCRAWNTLRLSEYRAAVRGRLAAGDPRHGTRNGYSNLGCRCDKCRLAHARAHREYMRTHPEQQQRANERAAERMRANRARKKAERRES